MTSPVRLGVCPAAAPTHTGVFSQKSSNFISLHWSPGLHSLLCSPRYSSQFIYARMWGHGVLPTDLPALFSTTLSPALLAYLCTNVGPQGLLVVRLPAPLVPHSASLGAATATRVLSAPPRCLSRPSYQSG